MKASGGEGEVPDIREVVETLPFVVFKLILQFLIPWEVNLSQVVYYLFQSQKRLTPVNTVLPHSEMVGNGAFIK